MKRILVLRHAKSDWAAEFGEDRDRPLASRGRAAAQTIGRYLQRIDEVPDRVISSPAVRAVTTVELAKEHGDWTCPVELEPDFYGGDSGALLTRLQRSDDAEHAILLVGHEPTCSEFVGRMIGGARVRFPTAALARIDCDVPCWSEVDYDVGRLIWQVVPRALEAFG